MRILAVLFTCACTGSGGETDDPVVGRCLSYDGPDPIELDGTLGPASASVEVRNGCDDPATFTASLADGYEGRLLLGEVVDTLAAGRSTTLDIAFDGEMMGGAFDTLRIDEGDDRHSVEVIATGPTPDLHVRGVPAGFVRGCPTEVPLEVVQTGTGRARVTSWTLEAQGPVEVQDADPVLPATILPEQPLALTPLVTVWGKEGTLTAQAEEVLAGTHTQRFDLVLDEEIEVVHRVAPAPDGPSLDVLLTVDRAMGPTHRTRVHATLQALLEHLSASTDVRIAGLIRDDGCPLNRTLPFVDGSWDADKAATHLEASMDLDRVRWTGTEGEHRYFTRVQAALDPTKTQEGGCNAWRREGASILGFHIAAHDDASVGTDPADHVTALRDLVSFDDMVLVQGIAGAEAQMAARARRRHLGWRRRDG